MLKTMIQFNRRQCLSLFAGAMASKLANAQVSFPTKPITIIVPYTAGGASDVGARLFQNELSKTLDQSVVIDNVSGAGGALGVKKLLRSPADGHTLIYGSLSECVLVPLINPAAGYKTEDFAAIALMSTTPAALVVKPDFPANTIEELIVYARTNPGKLSYGSPGIGTFQHLVAETIKNRTGTFMLHIPYRGGGNIMADVIAGQVDVGVTSAPNIIGLAAQGRIKVLGVTTAERLQVLPQVVSLRETPSLKGLDLQTWGMFLAPKGVPDAVLQKLNDALNTINAQPSMVEMRRKLGSTVPGQFNVAQTQSFLLRERDSYRASASRVKPE